MKRVLVLGLLALICEPAFAQGPKGSCTFTYNSISKKIEMRCEGGMAHAPLAGTERTLLISGRFKACVVKSNADQMKQNPKAGMFQTECK